MDEPLYKRATEDNRRGMMQGDQQKAEGTRASGQSQPEAACQPGRVWMTEGFSEGVTYFLQEPDDQAQAVSEGDQAAASETNYQLRRYDPQRLDGFTHECSNDVPYLFRACQEANQRSVQAAGFEQWWITDRTGKIIYPVETRPRVYVSPAAELDEVLQSFRDIQAITNAQALHDFLFLTRNVDDADRKGRLNQLVQELELTAAHVRGLVEGTPGLNEPY